MMIIKIIKLVILVLLMNEKNPNFDYNLNNVKEGYLAHPATSKH